MSSAEMNCELMDASIAVLPPFSRPFTTIGAVPSPFVEKATEPSSFRDFSKGSFGLFLSEASPVRTAAPSHKEEIAVKNLSVVPEFSAFITSSGVLGLPSVPSTVIFLALSSHATTAPMRLAASMVAFVSSERSGKKISLLPPSEATAIARCV